MFHGRLKLGVLILMKCCNMWLYQEKVALVSVTISTTTSLILTDALGILWAFEPWFFLYRYSSSLLLASSSYAAEIDVCVLAVAGDVV